MKHPAIRRLGGVISPHAFAAHATGREYLAERAEKVELHAEQRVQALEQAKRDVGAVTIAADEAPHREPIAQLYPRLIVLAILPTASDADAMAPAVAKQSAVEKLAAVIGVPLP